MWCLNQHLTNLQSSLLAHIPVYNGRGKVYKNANALHSQHYHCRFISPRRWYQRRSSARHWHRSPLSPRQHVVPDRCGVLLWFVRSLSPYCSFYRLRLRSRRWPRQMLWY